MRDIKSIEDANIVCRELQDQARLLTGSVIDFRGRRISNAAEAVNPKDYIIKAQVDKSIGDVLKEITKLNTRVDLLEKRVKALEP